MPRACCLLASLAVTLLATSSSLAGDPSSAIPGPATNIASPVELHQGLGSLPCLNHARSRSVCAENPTGAKGKGGMAVPNPSEPSPPASARAADDLGQGWKVRPFLRVNKGETATLMDVDGPGVIQHLWVVAGLSRANILRFYWDGEPTPSIEVPAPDFFAVGHGKFAPVNSLAVVVNPRNALNCYWPMPFRKHVRVTIQALGWKGSKYDKLADDVASVAYWYQAEPHVAFPRLPPMKDRLAAVLSESPEKPQAK